MIHYFVISSTSVSGASVSEFVRSFGREIPRQEADPPRDPGADPVEWVVAGDTSAFFVMVSRFGRVFFEDPEVMMAFLGIGFEPSVIVVSRGSGRDRTCCRFILECAAHFKGIVDYDGIVVGKVYDGEASDLDVIARSLQKQLDGRP